MKLSLKALSLLVLGCLLATDLQAQDPRYSQYYSAPHRLNPAMIGMFEGTLRAGINYRSQWGSVAENPFQTYSVMGDARIAVFQEDFVGVGLNVTGDKSGSAGYGQMNVDLGGSFQKKLGQGRRSSWSRSPSSSYLSIGGQIGYGQRGVNPTQLTFSEQYDPQTGEYLPGLPSGEPDLRTRRSYLDLNAGLLWYMTINDRNSVFAGLGMQHLNTPDISFFNSAPAQVDSAGNPILAVDYLYTRWSVHVGGEVQIGGPSSPVSLMPGAVLLRQGPSMELNLGTSLRYKQNVDDDVALKLGMWARVANAAISDQASEVRPESLVALVGLEYWGFQFGLSYDINISTLSVASGRRGAFELSMIYTNSEEMGRGMGCPTF